MDSNGRPRHKSTYGYLIFHKEIRTAPWKRQHLQPMVLVMLHGCMQKILRKVSSRHNTTSSPRLQHTSNPHRFKPDRAPALTGSVAICQEAICNRHSLAKGKSVFSPGTSLGWSINYTPGWTPGSGAVLFRFGFFCLVDCLFCFLLV